MTPGFDPSTGDSAAVVAMSVAAPWGPVQVAATSRGVVAVELMTTREAFAEGLDVRLGGGVAWVDAEAARPTTADPASLGHLRAAEAALDEAFDGTDAGVRALVLDLADRPAWDRAVLGAVRAIPRGEVRSYGDIARVIGRAGAARAVGGAVGRNPIGLVIPCHRVIAADGTLGGYGGGWWGDRDRLLDLKATLLASEGRIVPRSQIRHGRAR